MMTDIDYDKDSFAPANHRRFIRSWPWARGGNGSCMVEWLEYENLLVLSVSPRAPGHRSAESGSTADATDSIAHKMLLSLLIEAMIQGWKLTCADRSSAYLSK